MLASLGSEQQIPLNIGPFLLMVLGLMLFAHLAVRRLAPDADPILLPVAALLNGLGYVVITSLDEKLAGLQATWTLVGVAGFVGVLMVVRRTRDLERYRYTFAVVGIGLLLLPLVPGVGRAIHGSRIWVQHRPDRLPARRAGQDLAGHLLRLVPGREARAAGHALVPHRPAQPARPQAPRPGAGGVGRCRSW